MRHERLPLPAAGSVERRRRLLVGCRDRRRFHHDEIRAELFIVRNVANLVPPYKPDSNYHGTSAAIEFAVRNLNVQHIIVLGHSHCGGIRFLCESRKGDEKREFIESWMSIVEQARDDGLAGEAQHRQAEREAVKVSLSNLLSFPWVKDRVEDEQLKLHGWWFDLKAGKLLAHEAEEGWKTAAG